MCKQIYSFDVFDTVLTRSIANPKDLFRIMQLRLPDEFPDLNPILFKAFHGVRVWAEFKARRLSSREDILLHEIYSVIGKWFNLRDEEQLELMDFEMHIEEQALTPVVGAVSHVHNRRSNAQVVFISDMYLPLDFIRGVLMRRGIAEECDKVYISGEYGLTKGSGRLFKQVLSELEITPTQLTHLGDNPVSDFLVPKSLGINFDDSVETPEIYKSRFSRTRLRSIYLMELWSAGLQAIKGMYV